MIIDGITLFISIANLVLTVFIFLNAKQLRQHVSFFVFSFLSTIWIFGNFLFRLSPDGIFGQLSYGFGVLFGTAGLFWVYDLIEEEKPKWMYYIVIPFSLLTFYISSFTNYVVYPFAELGLFGYSVEKGGLFALYVIYILILLTACLYKLTKKVIQEKNTLKKNQILLILIGCLIFGVIICIIEFLLPLFFDSFRFSSLGCIAYFFLFIFIVYSILRYRLFGIKLILTQFLIVIYLSLLLFNFLISDSLNEYIWGGFLFVASAWISYLIVKNIFKEAELDKKLLFEAQKSLELERVIRQEFLNESNEVIKKMEKIISGKDV